MTKKDTWEERLCDRFELNETYLEGTKKDFQDFIRKEKEESEEKTKESIIDIFFNCYPSDMENFSTITHDQAYRLVKEFGTRLFKYETKPKSE